MAGDSPKGSASGVGELLFRCAAPQDIDTMVRIGDEGRAAMKAMGIDQWQPGGPTLEAVTADIARGYARVAVPSDPSRAPAGAPIAGIMSIYPDGEPDYDNVLSGEWLTESENDPARGEVAYVALHRVAVSQAWRRRGVARFMFGEAVREARQLGCTSIRIDTHPGNLPMQRTMESFGFVRCCEVELPLIAEKSKLRVGYELVL